MMGAVSLGCPQDSVAAGGCVTAPASTRCRSTSAPYSEAS